VNDSRFLAVYTVLPCLTAAFAAALFLTPRSIRPATAWLLAMLIAGLLTLGASAVIQRAAGGTIPVASLVKAYATLYFLPTIVLTSVALSLRDRLGSRTAGIVIILALFLGISFMSRRASGYFLDFVNAAG
jgi:hypothetical protein